MDFILPKYHLYRPGRFGFLTEPAFCATCVHKGFYVGAGSVRKPNLPAWENLIYQIHVKVYQFIRLL